ncbi:NYN domain-containing protein [Prescottella subtropica]|uniref:NYN domain-containing protein n=1 Tax=Prescottella subtropica TaxID=2545757 RepID=UPI001479344B|nr:NYN domain-containing protein [Prescottella subtropica]
MRSTCSLYIDAGYLLASAATRVTGTSLRGGIRVDYAALIQSLIDAAGARAGLPVLRVHWYDSARNGIPDARQERIGELPKVKLRLGRFGVDGEQKGVDLRIGLDLVAHARNNASDVFFLVSGDGDLTEAVEEAQVHGIEVVVLAVPNAAGTPHGMSRHLVRAADELDLIDGAVVDAAVVKVDRAPTPELIPEPTSGTAPAVAEPPAAAAAVEPAPSPALVAAARPAVPTPGDIATVVSVPSVPRPAATPTPTPRPQPQPQGSVLAYSSATGAPARIWPGYDDPTDEHDLLVDDVVARVLAAFRKSASADDKLDLERARPSIPRDIDRALLLDASDVMQRYDLDENIRYLLRARFWVAYDAT